MKKTFSVKPVNEVELRFEDGKSIILMFDVNSLMNFSEIDGGINSILKEKSISELCAKIIFAAGAHYNEGFDLQEARRIVSELDIQTVTDIINEFNQSVGVTQNEVQTELQKKLMAQFLTNLK
jgi:hypothetical protein